MQSMNGAQFLNIIPLFLSPNRFAAPSVPVPVMVTVTLTSVYASLESDKLDLTLKF